MKLFKESVTYSIDDKMQETGFFKIFQIHEIIFSFIAFSAISQTKLILTIYTNETGMRKHIET